jgi:K+-sensing histidine kinase KdpD
MGLGLAIVKMFIDRFKGKVKAFNNEQGGATFMFSFPLTNIKRDN